MSDLTNIDIAKPVQVYRNLKNRDVCGTPGMVQGRMKLKPHKARMIKNAERRVGLLQNHIDELYGIANLYRQERNLMAKLAATGPAFYYPLEAMAAEQLRDDILRVSCRLNPDGTPIRGNATHGHPPKQQQNGLSTSLESCSSAGPVVSDTVVRNMERRGGSHGPRSTPT